MNKDKKDIFLQILSTAFLFFVFVLLIPETSQPQHLKSIQASIATPTTTPTSTPFNPFPYSRPEISYARSYRIMLVGDSMIGSLGPNAQSLRQHLIEYYPDHEFVNYNYGFGSTSIETLPNRLVNTTFYNEQEFPPILSQGFDLIIIESFAYNPLSQESPKEGIKKHIRILDESIKRIIQEKPEAALSLMTPIAPLKSLFAQGVYVLSPEQRQEWTQERIEYIQAVINYASKNNIPLINVYEKSLTSELDGNPIYISKDDFIHPSAEGVDFISKTIAEFIYKNNIFPE